VAKRAEVPELVRAAQVLEDEVQKLEALSRSVRKIRLDSEKSITRAAEELKEALALPERLGGGLSSLAAAMERMQSRQQAALEPLSACAHRIQERAQQLGAYMQAFADLGKGAGEATALLKTEGGDRKTIVEQAQAQLVQLAERSRSLGDDARANDFPDVAREADALRQRVMTLRKRLDDGAKG
jgi:chromosome segregation ATPase